MKKLKLIPFFLISANLNAVVDYDQYDDDIIESSSSPTPATTATSKGSGGGSAIGFPSLEYSTVKRESRENVVTILPRDGQELPSKLTRWDFGIRLNTINDIDVNLGVPLLQTEDDLGKHSEIGNPTLKASIVWFQGKAPEPVKFDILLHSSMPRRGNSAIYAHNRWDTGVGVGTSKRFGKALFRAQGLYVFKKNSSGAMYEVGDMLWASAALAVSLTQELDFQMVGDFKRAYALKEDGRKLIPQSNLNTVSPQMVIHMNRTIDLLIGGVFAINRGQFAGNEAAFGDISYDGLMGDQVTLGLGMEI